ncbi:MAG: SpoIIE family protein phosphatase [Candidatus Eremiobacteraeota bacterium]|nr:SpoIIE family protein phosphatase [Candidatus Eremiobacteraeota bacterium]
MTAAHIPSNDRERLAAVRRYDVLDTPPDGTFDRITALAARIFNVPIALVTIVDEDRIWFKSRFGLDGVQEIPRDPGLCASAICGDATYIVESARSDPRTLANPLVAGEFGLQFYAAVPLRTSDGFGLGNLVLIDRKPRTLTAEETAIFESLAGIVVDELELRLHAIGTVSLERSLREQSSALAREKELLYQREHRVASTLQNAMLPQAFPQLERVRFDAVYMPASAESEIGGDWYDAFVIDQGHVLLSIGDVSGHGLHAAALMGKVRQSLRAIALNETSPRALLCLLDGILLSEEEDAIVTAFVGIVDIESMQMQYANAGHPPPYLRDKGGVLTELSGTGAPLGLRSTDDPADQSVTLGAGSMLLMYTDGLTEATHDVLAGEKRLREAFCDDAIARTATPASDLRGMLLDEGTADDVAIMTVTFL